MNTHSPILLAGLVTLSPFLALAQNAPETEILERHANYNRVRVLNALDPGQLAELPPEERAFLEAEGGTYIQAASGLNYFSEDEWKPSQERFVEYEGGIVAQEGQTKVIISKDFMDPNGVVDLLTPNGPGDVQSERVRLAVHGLAIFDRKSGKSALIAEPQPSRAILIPPNQIIFPNALTGDGVSADVRMSYRLGSFETDVILRKFPEARNPDTGDLLVGPEIWNLSPENSVIEVWHRVVSAPEPVKEARVLKEEPQETRAQFVEPDIIDEELTFGAPNYELKFVQGKAFALTDAQGKPLEDPAQRDPVVPTAKRWLDLGPEGRFLVESVEYSSVRAALEALPRVQVNATRQPVLGRQKMLASGGARPSRAPIGASRDAAQTAAVAPGPRESRAGILPAQRAPGASGSLASPAEAGRMPALL